LTHGLTELANDTPSLVSTAWSTRRGEAVDTVLWAFAPAAVSTVAATPSARLKILRVPVSFIIIPVMTFGFVTVRRPHVIVPTTRFVSLFVPGQPGLKANPEHHVLGEFVVL
jgi:hypothetical protein